jgi:hypothetical protein
MSFCDHPKFDGIVRVFCAAYHAADNIVTESKDQEVILEALQCGIVGRIANWIMYQGVDDGHCNAIMVRMELYRKTLFRDYHWNDNVHGIFLARFLDNLQTRITTYIDEELMFVADAHFKQQILSDVSSVIDKLGCQYETRLYGDLLSCMVSIYGHTTLHNLNATKPPTPSEYDAFVFFRDLVTNHCVFDCIEFGYAFVCCNRSIFSPHVLDILKAAMDRNATDVNIQSIYMDVDRKEMFVSKPNQDQGRHNSWQKLMLKSVGERTSVRHNRLQKVRHRRIVITF